MRLEELVNKVDGRWRGEFVRFIQTGEASDEFLDYLDSDPSCQQAVEEAFAAQSAALEEFARLMDPEELATAIAADEPEEVADQLASSLSRATELTATEREEVLERVIISIRTSVPAEKKKTAEALVADLGRKVGMESETAG